MAKLFVSYSRKDSIAARKLIEAFKSIEQEVWVDWESIPPAVDWLEQIFRGIEEADAFIFLISPDSVASEVCKVEVGRAALNNKRIIPIVLRDVDHKTASENIRKLNWTFIRETDNFEEGLAKVKTAIQLDLDWLEEHRRLQVRALEWHRKKDVSLLLHGRDLRNAQHMVATATSKDPTPTDLQQTFILHSRRSERNRTIAWIATGIAVVIMAVLSLIAVNRSNEARLQQKFAEANAQEANIQAIYANLNRQRAEKNERIARANEEEAKAQKALAETNEKIAEAQRSAAKAQIYQTRPGELYTSTLLAIDSWQNIPSEEAEEILRRNISLLPLPVAQVSQAGKINAIAFSPEGNAFVTGSADGTTCSWRVKDAGKLFCTPSGQPSVNALAFSPDGTFIATGNQSGLVEILDAENGNVLYTYQRVQPKSSTVQVVDIKNGDAQNEYTLLEIPVRSINFRPPKGQQLAVAYDDGEIPVFDPKTGKISSPLWTGNRPNVSGFSPNGVWLAVGSENGRASIWNLSNNDIFSPSNHRGGVLAIAFSPDNSRVATSGNDNTALIISLRSKKELFRLPNQNSVRDLAFSPDGSWLVTVSDDQRIRIWDTLTGDERLGMSQDGIVTEVVVSPNGQWIATTGDDRTVRVWNTATGAEIFQIPLDNSGSVLAFSNDGSYLVSTDQNGAIDIWDLSVMAVPKVTLQSDGIVDNVQYSPSGERVAVSAEKRVWLLTPDQESGLKERELGSPTRLFKSNVKNITFSPDSKLLGVLTEGNEVAIYNIENRGLRALEVSSLIQSIAFSPDSQQLLTSDSDGNIQTWDVLNAKFINDLTEQYPQVPSLASNSELLAIGSRDQITILDANGDGGFPAIESDGDNALLVFSPVGSLLASSDSSGKINILKYQNSEFAKVTSFVKDQAASLSFNPDGTLLAVGTAKNVYLMDVASGKEIARIPHIDVVNGVSFSADGNTLATASAKVLQFWDIAEIQQIKIDDLVSTACSRLVKNFDTAQWSTLFVGEKYRTLCEKLPVPQ